MFTQDLSLVWYQGREPLFKTCPLMGTRENNLYTVFVPCLVQGEEHIYTVFVPCLLLGNRTFTNDLSHVSYYGRKRLCKTCPLFDTGEENIYTGPVPIWC